MLTLICWLLNLKLSEIIMFFFLFTSVYLVMFSGHFQFLFSCYVSSQQFRGSFQYRPFDWSAGSLGSLANAERKGSCLCQSVQVKKKEMIILEFVKLKMIVKNLDNKQSFLFSEVSRASQEEKAKKMLPRRAELCR